MAKNTGKSHSKELSKLSSRQPRVAHSRPTANLINAGGSAPKTKPIKRTGKQYPGS